MALRGDAKESKSKMMFCGKHVRPQNVPREPRNGTERFIKPSQRYRRSLARGEKRGSCICDYNDYAQLRQEREVVAEPPTQTINFLDILPDIRNKIYEHMFHQNEAVEFCPEPCLFNGGNNSCPSSHGPEWLINYNTVANYHQDLISKNFAPFIRFLRANKQIHKEATGYLYSGNEFRFSNSSGWVALDHFMHKIGLKNCASLRKITVCHPVYTILPVSQTADSSFAITVLNLFTGESRYPGFEKSKRWFEDPLTRDPALVLEKIGKLRHLRLTIPMGFTDQRTFTTAPVDASRFENLKITISQLLTYHIYHSRPGVNYRATSYPEVFPEVARQIAEDAGQGWSYESPIMDDYGCYLRLPEFGIVKSRYKGRGKKLWETYTGEGKQVSELDDDTEEDDTEEAGMNDGNAQECPQQVPLTGCRSRRLGFCDNWFTMMISYNDLPPDK